MTDHMNPPGGEAFAFYVSMQCETCDRDMYKLVASSLTHHDRLVVPFDIASQYEFNCDNCGSSTYTDDFADHCMHEAGEEPDDDEGEDDDDE